jgi:hypothetical protein
MRDSIEDSFREKSGATTELEVHESAGIGHLPHDLRIRRTLCLAQ